MKKNIILCTTMIIIAFVAVGGFEASDNYDDTPIQYSESTAESASGATTANISLKNSQTVRPVPDKNPTQDYFQNIQKINLENYKEFVSLDEDVLLYNEESDNKQYLFYEFPFVGIDEMRWHILNEPYILLLADVAYSDENDEYEYNVLKNGRIEITRYLGTSLDVVIPDEIDGYPVCYLRDYVFTTGDWDYESWGFSVSYSVTV